MTRAGGRASYPCFACGSPRLALHTEIPNLDTLTGALLPRVALSLCEDCGLIQQNPCITRERMSELYATLEDKVTVEGLEHAATEQEGRARLAALRTLVPPPARLLEVGCSDGTFLNLARETGYQVAGVDPSATNIEKARRLYRGLDVRQGLAEDITAGTKYDVVCHFYVMEHSFEPLKFLATLRGLLRDGGLMFFEVPDVARFSTLPFANFLFPYQHTIHLSPETAADLLARAGFEVLPSADTAGSKSYGMRLAARAGDPSRPGSGRTAASRRHLDAYFGRRKALLDGMTAKVRRWSAETAGRPGPCVIFGAGENGRVLLAETPVRALFPDLAFCDNNTALHGRSVDGVTVVPPGGLAGLQPALVIAASIDYQDDMARQVESLGIPRERIVKLY